MFSVQYKSLMDFWIDLRTFDTLKASSEYMRVHARIFGKHVNLRIETKNRDVLESMNGLQIRA